MKNASFTMSLAMALSLAAAAVAGAQSPQRADGTHAIRQDTSVHRGRDGRAQRGGRDKMLLRGITLSSAQKTRLETLRKAQRKEFEQMRGTAARPARDSAGMTARRTAMEQRREQQFSAIRDILSAEQRSQFDKNATELKARRSQRGQFTGRKGEHAEGRDHSDR
ncbi:MAG: Spy/CpxP family protein refolding chaperone [bacterium]